MAAHRGFLIAFVQDLDRADYSGAKAPLPEVRKLLEESNMDVDESDLVDGAFDMSWSEEG